MNKLAHEPVNTQNPFYYKDHTGYHASGNLMITGVVESHWDWNPAHTHKIMWMETLHAVQEVTHVPACAWVAHVHKQIIWQNNQHHTHEPWLSVTHGDQITWGHKLITQGVAWLVYDPFLRPQVRLQSDQEIILITLK